MTTTSLPCWICAAPDGGPGALCPTCQPGELDRAARAHQANPLVRDLEALAVVREHLREEKRRQMPRLDHLPTPTEWAGYGSPYGLAALARATSDLAHAPEGMRNNTAVAVAYAVGRIVGAGHLQAEHAAAALAHAADMCGMHPREAADTIRRGLTKGALNPRDVAPVTTTRTPPRRGVRPTPPTR